MTAEEFAIDDIETCDEFENSTPITQEMEKTQRILKEENSYVKSEIEGLSDLVWSMGARTICPGGKQLIQWFYTAVPAFDNRVPMDILKEDGECELYKWMKMIPC